MEPRWLSPQEQRAWRAYRRMRTLLDLQIARDLNHDSDLSEADYDVLSTLSERDDREWRARELADRLLWSTSRLAHHLGRMERRGLVRRQPSETDARGAVVTLTDSGWSRLREAAPHHVESVRKHLIDLLTPEELDGLGTVAQKVLDHLAPAPEPRA